MKVEMDITNNLKMVLDNYENSCLLDERDLVVQYIDEGIKHYKLLFESIGNKKIILVTIFALFDKLEKNVTNKITCKKGCNSCCKMNVDLSETETEVILDYVGTLEVREINHLKEQAKFKSKEEHFLHPHGNCVFLSQNGDCSIYKIRPLACRKYFVVSDPKLCGVKNGQISVNVDIDMEIIISAISRFQGESILGKMDSMAKQILKKISKTN